MKSDSERQDCIETQFNDFKSFSDQFWLQQYPEDFKEQYEPNEFMGTLTEEQFNELCQIIIDTGSWRFADRAKTIDKETAAMAMFSIIKQTKQVASEFGVDIFNLPAQLQFNFMQFQQNNAVPILKSYYKQVLLEIHVLNDRYRPPKTLFGIQDFAMSWGYVNDVRLLLAAKNNGLVVSQYSD